MPIARPRLPVRWFAAMVAMIAALFAAPVAAQDSAASDGGEMVIATREAPPFAMKDDSGEWDGLAIDLWRDIAADQGYSYHFEETDLAGMIEGVVDGRYDASVGALTITSSREAQVDFTHPFYATGFGIAVRKSPAAWLTLFTNFFTWQFLRPCWRCAGCCCSSASCSGWWNAAAIPKSSVRMRPASGRGSGFRP